MTIRGEPVIQIEGLWKRYGFPPGRALQNGWARLRAGARDGPGLRDQWALRDVHLKVQAGETIGIVGRNGAGKSTLLKILAGVTPPTRGRYCVGGRLFPMIELNAGLHPELTGRENMRLLGAFMGLTRKQIATKLQEMEEFCELGDAIDHPVRTYSSGMMARIGFAVAMYVDADILLIDEVLSVGDFAFQKKCVARMSQITNSGATILFVSHNPYLIERMCDRAFLMQAGSAEELGEVSDVIHRYFTLDRITGNHVVPQPPWVPEKDRPGSGELRFTGVELLDEQSSPTTVLTTGQPVTVRLHYRTLGSLEEPNLSFEFIDPLNTIIACCAMTAARKGMTLEGRGFLDCHLRSLPLMPNEYLVRLRAASNVLLDLVEAAGRFAIHANPDVTLNSGNRGIVYLDGRWAAPVARSDRERSRRSRL